MKRLLFIGAFFVAGSVFAAAPTITQTAPVVKQGATFQFSEGASAGGTWACSATNSTGGVTACSGSVASGTGIYTAPSSVTAQHVYGGMQIAPNNSVYNVRVDSLPVQSSSTFYMNAIGVYGGNPHWNTDFPINYVNSSVTRTMNFLYTAPNNGTYEIPAFPNAKAENGWFNALIHSDGADHHVIMVDTTTGNLSEFYQYLPGCTVTAASVASNIATLTCSENPQSTEFLSGTTITVGSFTGADTYFNLASTSVITVTATSISYALNHANASASTLGSVSKSQADATGLLNSASGIIYSSMNYTLPTNNATDAAGMELQPLILNLQEVERAVATGGEINHAMRGTLALAVEASSNVWPATTYATDGGTVPFGTWFRLKATVDESTYSVIAQKLVHQLKHYGIVDIDGGNNGLPMNAEVTRWPKAYYDALAEITAANLLPRMEVIASTTMMVSATSSLTKYNREIVTFTRSTDSATASVDVALMGPAVNFEKDAINIMAGTPATLVNVLNNYGGYTCSMSPSTGTLTSGCLYTPPTNLLVATQTIVTATSLINSSATAQTTVTIFPSTGIYSIPSKTSNYVDTTGNTWLARSGISSPDSQGCCACDNSASFSGTDASLYNCQIINAFQGGDQHMDFYVQNGTYKVTYNYGTIDAAAVRKFKLSAGNSEIAYNLDPSATVGQYGNYQTTSAVVTNNFLQFGIYGMNAQGAGVSSLSVVLVSSGAVAAQSNTAITGNGKCIGNGTIKL